MSDENRVSILVCKDAGPASRTLLARADLRIRWALTPEEAAAVIRMTKCAVVITRIALAKSVLSECAKAKRQIASVVLLEPSQWSEWRSYFEAGATSVLRAGAVDELLDAMTDATGVPFRAAPRVPLDTEVSFGEGGGGSWKTLNISNTGLCVIDFPPYALGSEVDLVIELSGKTLEFNAVVSQIFRMGTQRAVGLAFAETTPEFRTYVADYTSRQEHKHRLITEPTDAFDPLDENTVMSLRLSTVQGDSLALMRALTTDGTVTHQAQAEPWLVAACESFTPIEVSAIQTPKAAPPWAHDAVLARLRTYEARARAGSAPPSEQDVRLVFGLCQRLAESAAGSDGDSLVQVTNIRGELLRALYDPSVLYGASDPD